MKPLKKKLLEKPLTDTAAVTEEGPGIGNIFIFYDKDFSAEGLKKDIKKILKVSRIG